MIKDYYALSDTGVTRENNQDAFYTDPNRQLFIVADGMGGHNAGDVASRLAISTVLDFLDTQKGLVQNLADAVYKANSIVFKKATDTPKYSGMGTTMDLCVVQSDTLFCAHVGDSRVYVQRDRVLKQITDDHSFVSELLSSGSITQSQADNHPMKNLITRAIGTDESVEPDIIKKTVGLGDIVLMCSDGLTNMVTDNEINEILLNTPNLMTATENLINLANRHGGYDNITVVLFKL